MTHSFSTTRVMTFLIFLVSATMASAATFTVTNANDSGPGSLREALTQANSNAQPDTIRFDPNFFSTPRTITLASGELPIAKDDVASNNPGRLLTVDGPGADLLTISGNNASRVFHVASRANVALRGMTVRNGISVGADSDRNGGGIYATGAYLNLSNMTVRNNSATEDGGGIYLSGIVSFTMADCLVTENFATSYGGGLYAPLVSPQGVVTIRNSVISNNTTENEVAGMAIARGIVTIENCLITGNRSGLASGGNNDIGGLGLFGTTGTTATVTDTTISNNTAGTPEHAGSYGGVYADGGDMTFRRVTVSGNVAHGQNCGGIYLRGTKTLIDSTVSGNQNLGAPNSTLRQGGGILTANSTGQIFVTNTTIANNTAGMGGGIANFTDELFVTNSTIVNNTASDRGPGIPGGGGGINNADSFGGVTHIQNTIVANNSGQGSENFGPNVVGTFVSNGYNLIGNTGSAGSFTGFGATGDQLNVDPLLNANGLQNNGGATLTIALQPGSPAIDKGRSSSVLTDQRGLPRQYDHPSIPNAGGGDGSDIGAFEDQPPNTQPGSNRIVQAPAGDASVTFSSVAQGGFTTFGAIVPPSSAGVPPQGYTILDNAPAYDIATTAAFTPPITVSFVASSITTASEFARVRILHSENGQLVDRTILAPDSPAPDFGTRTVSARVNSLSPFVIALAPTTQLLNVSTRLRVQTGDNALIGGFIISGTASKRVIVRAIGPSLTAFGIPGALANPVLTLNGPAGFTAITNDDWAQTQQVEIQATIPPSNPSESAIVATLAPGAYTAVVRGVNNGTGVGLVEAYDLEPGVDAKLANISTRGFVETGESVMIGGLIAGPASSASTQMLVRAIGPSLTQFGVPGALQDPSLELRDGNGGLLASNNDWRDTQQTAIEATQLAPSHPNEAAILAPLAPGSYTAIVRGVGDTTGVGLVEVYNLQ